MNKPFKAIGWVLVSAWLLAGCARAPEPSLQTATLSSPIAASPRRAGNTPIKPDASQASCLQDAPEPPSTARRATVARTVDGDTLELSDKTKVRLIGINTPESVDPRRPVQAYGKEASANARQLLEGQSVMIQPGQTPRDKYGRTLAWLWLSDGRFVNGLLVQQGYAQVYTFADNPEHADLLRACQQEARAAGRGLWMLPDYQDGQQAAKLDRRQTSPAQEANHVPDTQSPGLTLAREPGTVHRGDTAMVVARTAPGIRCSITVVYKSGPSKSEGLGPVQASGKGEVSWSWTVGMATAPGIWPVTITCGGQSVQTAVTVR